MNRAILTLDGFERRDQPALLGSLGQLTSWLSPVSIGAMVHVSPPTEVAVNAQVGLLSVHANLDIALLTSPVSTLLTPPADTTVSTVLPPVTNLLAPVTNILTPVTNILTPVTNTVSNILTPVTNILTPVTNTVSNILTPVTNTVTTVISDLPLEDVIQPLITGVSEVVDTLLPTNTTLPLVNIVDVILQDVVSPVVTVVDQVVDVVLDIPIVGEVLTPVPVSPGPVSPPVSPGPVSPPVSPGPVSPPTTPVTPLPETGGGPTVPPTVPNNPSPSPVTPALPPTVTEPTPVTVIVPEVINTPVVNPTTPLIPVVPEVDIVTTPPTAEVTKPAVPENSAITLGGNQQRLDPTPGSPVVETTVAKIPTVTTTPEATTTTNSTPTETIPGASNTFNQTTTEPEVATSGFENESSDLADSDFDLFPQSSSNNSVLRTPFSESPLESESVNFSGLAGSELHFGLFASFNNLVLGTESYREDAVTGPMEAAIIPSALSPTILSDTVRELAYSADVGELFDHYLSQDVSGLQEEIDAYLSGLQDALPDIDSGSTLRWLLYGLAGGAAFYVGKKKSKRSMFAGLRARDDSHDDEFMPHGSGVI